MTTRLCFVSTARLIAADWGSSAAPAGTLVFQGESAANRRPAERALLPSASTLRACCETFAVVAAVAVALGLLLALASAFEVATVGSGRLVNGGGAAERCTAGCRDGELLAVLGDDMPGAFDGRATAQAVAIVAQARMTDSATAVVDLRPTPRLEL